MLEVHTIVVQHSFLSTGASSTLSSTHFSQKISGVKGHSQLSTYGSDSFIFIFLFFYLGAQLVALSRWRHHFVSL